MPPRLPDESNMSKPNTKNDPTAEDKARPVRCIHFSHITKWPGVAGAGIGICVGAPPASNYLSVDSIFLYRGEFVVNGKYFMNKHAGCILCHEF